MKNQVKRMCFICRNTFEKKDLKRIVKDSNGNVFYDKTSKADGRGAYLCGSQECLAKLKNHKILNKAFKCELSNDIYIKLCEDLFGQN